jgi:hypothetical protein
MDMTQMEAVRKNGENLEKEGVRRKLCRSRERREKGKLIKYVVRKV